MSRLPGKGISNGRRGDVGWHRPPDLSSAVRRVPRRLGPERLSPRTSRKDSSLQSSAAESDPWKSASLRHRAATGRQCHRNAGHQLGRQAHQSGGEPLAPLELGSHRSFRAGIDSPTLRPTASQANQTGRGASGVESLSRRPDPTRDDARPYSRERTPVPSRAERFTHPAGLAVSDPAAIPGGALLQLRTAGERPSPPGSPDRLRPTPPASISFRPGRRGGFPGRRFSAADWASPSPHSRLYRPAPARTPDES